MIHTIMAHYLPSNEVFKTQKERQVGGHKIVIQRRTFRVSDTYDEKGKEDNGQMRKHREVLPVLPDWAGCLPNWASFDRLGPENNALGG